MSTELLTTDLTDGLLTVTINRPEVRNALNAEVLTEIGEVLGDAESDHAVQGIIFTGAGEKAERLPLLEERLNAGQPAGEGLVDAAGLLGDRFASPEYRAHLVDVLAGRAATQAAISGSRRRP